MTIDSPVTVIIGLSSSSLHLQHLRYLSPLLSHVLTPQSPHITVSFTSNDCILFPEPTQDFLDILFYLQIVVLFKLHFFFLLRNIFLKGSYNKSIVAKSWEELISPSHFNPATTGGIVRNLKNTTWRKLKTYPCIWFLQGQGSMGL